MLKETLREIVRTQKAELMSSDFGTEREELAGIDLSLPYAVVLTGIRRCGKSTLLRQLAKRVKNFYYFDFEDARAAGFTLSDFQNLEEVLHEEFGNCENFFFDEVQNVEKWELFVRSGLDRQKKFVLTGSNASLLSKELGTRLTGRHLRTELFPFSFREMLAFRKKEASAASFDDYLKRGGFPEFLKYGKESGLRELFNDVLVRDIMIRYKLRDQRTIKEMVTYLLTNVGKEFSYNKLKSLFKLGSTTTVSAYISFFEDAYLLFTVPRFDYSLKKQIVNPKKVYAIDNGFTIVNSVSFSSDRGRMLENAVFLHLRRKHKEIFYFKEANECDFLVRERGEITSAIQVCYVLTEENKDRELGGLTRAMKVTGAKNGIIITMDQEDKIEDISVLPAWKWMSLRLADFAGLLTHEEAESARQNIAEIRKRSRERYKRLYDT